MTNYISVYSPNENFLHVKSQDMKRAETVTNLNATFDVCIEEYPCSPRVGLILSLH